jgi:beta-N-acetylhexosaminidase
MTRDTHVALTHTERPLADFETSDWLPFRKITLTLPAAIMLSQVIIDEIDPETPASYSAPVIEYLRKNLGFKGLLITDDLSMTPIKKLQRRNYSYKHESH